MNRADFKSPNSLSPDCLCRGSISQPMTSHWDRRVTSVHHLSGSGSSKTFTGLFMDAQNRVGPQSARALALD